MNEIITKEKPAKTHEIDGIYSHYALFVLVIVYIFNFIDRNILSILAEDIKADLNISDANMGFLYGTVFAVFYAVCGLPLARIADVWNRRTLISIGIATWSLMTTLSGFARSFPVLAACRIGVSVGEASASPAAISMLSDYYSPRVRATVMAIYSSGIFIGGGIGLFLGGWILDLWNSTYPVNPPFNLKGWHVAFIAVGLPGLIIAVIVRTLREPRRGISEGLDLASPTPPLAGILKQELAAFLPPFSLVLLVRQGGSLKINFISLLFIVLICWSLIHITGSIEQWVCLGVGIYITFTWLQSLAVRDSASFSMVFRCRSLVYINLGNACMSFVTYGIGFWAAPYLIRIHNVDASDVGLYLGLAFAFGGFIGIVSGGIIADKLKQYTPNGRLYLGVITTLTTTPIILCFLQAESLTTAYWLIFTFYILTAMWIGVPPSTANDLVMPRMRAMANAVILLMVTFIGLALGPYTIGKISDFYLSQGINSGKALGTSLSYALLINIIAFTFVILAMRNLAKDESTRLERAKALGEEITTTEK